jgi:flagellar biosynthesis chaperone FliJ
MANRLHVVARLRVLQERRALGAAALAQRAEVEAEQRLAGARDAYDRRPHAEANLTPAALMSLRTQGLGALEGVAESKAGMERATSELQTAVGAALAASMRRKSAERLVERKDAEAAQAAAIAGQRQSDELGVMLFARAKAGGA